MVTGGRVTRVWRIDHRRDFWGIQVTPDSHSSNATLALAPNRPCTIGGAICTFDGRRLSNRLEHTVATAVVVARPNIPATGTPSISGTAQVGETLTADTSAIADGNGLDATEFSYQWLADSVDIQGATGNTYILVAADVGKTITVLVSFTDDGGNEERLTSAATAVVAYVDGPPGAPREVNVQAGDTELLVSWQPPAEENKAPEIDYHGTTHTHIDAFCHFSYEGKHFNGFDVDENISAEGGCSKLGIAGVKDKIFTRAILIDIPRLKGVPYLEPGAHVYAEDIEAWEEQAGVRLGPGDALLLRTGRWARRAAVEPFSDMAGFDASIAPFLKERDIALLGSDAIQDVGIVPGFPAYPVHHIALITLGVNIFDNLDLEAAAETAARMNRWEFLLVAAPVSSAHSTGSPISPVAVF